MIKNIIHYSDLHLKLYKQHSRDKYILDQALEQWKKIKPDRIVFYWRFSALQKPNDTRINKTHVLVDGRNRKNL